MVVIFNVELSFHVRKLSDGACLKNGRTLIVTLLMEMLEPLAMVLMRGTLTAITEKK